MYCELRQRDGEMRLRHADQQEVSMSLRIWQGSVSQLERSHAGHEAG